MVIRQKLTRFHRLTLAVLLLIVLFLPLLGDHANAYSLPSSRYIKLSSSANAATDVTYQVSFTTNQGGASASIGGLVLEFCSNTPIIGDTCTAPSGFSLHAFSGNNTLALANQVGVTDWAKDTTNATANRLILSRTPASVSTATVITVDLGDVGASDGVTNPSTTNTTFYARVLTFATQTGAEQYTSTNVDNTGANTVYDAGGFAMSTAAQITITAKVPEKLTFCVFTQDDTNVPSQNSCGTANTPNGDLGGTAVTLGNNNGVLSDAGPYVDKNAKYSIATNALYGVAIRVKGGTLATDQTNVACQAASSSCGIDAIGGTAASSAPGTEQFGFCTYQSFGSGLTPASPYNNANCSTTTQTAGTGTTGGTGTSQFAFDNNNTTGTRSTYGMTFADKVAGTFSTGIIAFIGNITTTTEPGIYTTTLTFIATGTY